MSKYILLSLSLMAPLGANAMGCFGWCKKPSNRVAPITFPLDAVVVSPALATGRADTEHAHREIQIRELGLIHGLAQAAGELAAERVQDQRNNITTFAIKHGGETYSPRTSAVLLGIRRKMEKVQAQTEREADRFETAAATAQVRQANLIAQNQTI